MSRYVLLFFLLLDLPSINGAPKEIVVGEILTLTTNDGRSFENAKVSGLKPESLTLLTRKGIFQIPRSALPKEIADRMPRPEEPAKEPEFWDSESDPLREEHLRVEAMAASVKEYENALVQSPSLPDRPRAAVLTGASATKNLKLGGQIFIAVQSGEVIKLASTRVSAYPKDYLIDFIKWRQHPGQKWVATKIFCRS